MILKSVKVVLIVLSLLWFTACSFAPLTPRVDAASIGKNEVKIESNLGPTTSFGVLYGAGNNLDVALELEQSLMTTAWARYSFINNPNGLSFAGNGGVFVATGDNRSNGWYTGLLLSNQFNTNVRWSAGVRYAVLDYEYGELDSFWFSGSLEFDNPDDAAHNLQVESSLSWRMKPHLEFALGLACQNLVRNKNPLTDDNRCYPIIGMSFYRL